MKDRDRVDEVLDQWLSVSPGSDVEAVHATLRVWRLAHLHNERQQALFTSHGLKPGWLDVLFSLRRTPAPHRLPALRLAREVVLSPGGLTARVDRMEAAGLLRRRSDPGDRRAVLVELTARGTRVADDVIAADARLARELTSSLDERERRTFVELLRKQIVALEGDR